MIVALFFWGNVLLGGEKQIHRYKNSNFDLESALREYAFQFILPGSAMDYTELQHKVINMWWSMNRP